MPQRRLLPIVALLFTSSFAFADDGWTLTTADFKTQPVSLLSIEPSGVRVKDAEGKEKRVSSDAFLQIERTTTSAFAPAAPGGTFTLHIAGGDQVCGEPVRMEGDQFVWKNPSVGEIAVPLSRLIGITKSGKSAPDGTRKEDVVTLGNGDAVRGIITGVADGAMNVKGETGDIVPVPFASIDSVQFASVPAAGGTDDKGYRVRLDDGSGSSVVAGSLKLAGDQIDLTLGKDVIRTLPLARIAAVELVNGPAVFLSSRTPSESVYLPFFGSDQDYPARINRTVDGSTDLRFGGKSFRRAIGVHSYSRLSWTLDGKSYSAFRTQYAIDPNRTGADVTVRILVDDKVAHEQKNVRAGSLSDVVTVDTSGAKKLTLEVDYGENLHVNDHLTWLEPALLRKKPAIP